jgi:hypothetical protein
MIDRIQTALGETHLDDEGFSTQQLRVIIAELWAELQRVGAELERVRAHRGIPL